MTNEQIANDVVDIAEQIATKKLAIRSNTPTTVYNIRMKALEIAGEIVKAKLRRQPIAIPSPSIQQMMEEVNGCQVMGANYYEPTYKFSENPEKIELSDEDLKALNDKFTKEYKEDEDSKYE